jgi:hypothetical protein
MIKIDRLSNQNKVDFHDYCWLYASHMDQSTWRDARIQVPKE